MIVIACDKCGMALRTSGEEVDDLLGKHTSWYPDSYPCPTCPGKARIVEGKALQELSVRDLNPQEVFAALHGLGFPEERECGKLAVQQALSSSPIKKVRTRHVRGNRCCLDVIELEDGLRLYLGSSTHGAVVYRIARFHSYTKKLEEKLERKDAEAPRRSDTPGAATGEANRAP